MDYRSALYERVPVEIERVKVFACVANPNAFLHPNTPHLYSLSLEDGSSGSSALEVRLLRVGFPIPQAPSYILETCKVWWKFIGSNQNRLRHHRVLIKHKTCSASNGTLLFLLRLNSLWIINVHKPQPNPMHSQNQTLKLR